MIRVVPQRNRCWKAKLCFPTIALAESHAIAVRERNRRLGACRPGCELVVYYCALHGSFHFGHDTRKDCDQ